MDTILLNKDIIVAIATIISLLLGYGINQLRIRLYSRRYNIYTHNIFNEIYSMINDVTLWKIPEQRNVLKLMFLEFLNTYYDSLKKFLEQTKERKLNKKDLFFLLNDFSIEFNEKYHSEWIKNLDVPEKLISKVDSKINKTKDKFVSKMTDVIYSGIYVTVNIKIFVILDIASIMLTEIENDFLDFIFMEIFNGDLLNVQYKGVYLNDEQYRNAKK